MKMSVQLVAVSFLSLLTTAPAAAQNAVLYDFTATWCGPCQQMNPIVHKLEREGFPIQKVDIDQNPDLARKYNVSSIPAFVLVANGQEVSRFVGRTTEAQLRQMLASVPQGNAAAAASSPPGVNSPALNGNSAPAARSAGPAAGFGQPVLGNSAPFPSAEVQPVAHRAEPAAAAADTNYHIRNLAAPGGPAPFPAKTASLQPSDPSSAAAPVIRAQLDEANGVGKATPHFDSKAANVRIRIRDDKGINYGSGTVIDSRPGMTYVLTCGHIFRNLTASSKVDVDIFTDDRFETVAGAKVEKYDLDADVGLISLPLDGVLPVAKLARLDAPIAVGENVISVGCSGGQPPTVETLNVTSLNRYTGPDNIECTGIPVQGRSGGGLFNQDHEIVGICIGADTKEKRGLYCALAPVVEMLTSCNLGHVIRRGQSAPQMAENGIPASPAAEFAAFGEPPAAAGVFGEAPAGFDNSADSGPFAENPGQPAAGYSSTAAPQSMQALQNATGARLTIVIEDPRNPGQTQVVIVPAATARLIADLTGELQTTQTIAANRTSTAAGQDRRTAELSSNLPLNRDLREADRSPVLPTDFSAAQPYRRLRIPAAN